MPDFTLSVETAPDPADVRAIEAGLTEHAIPYAPGPGFQPIGVFARDAAGTLVGGVYGKVNWTWLHIGLFWIEEQRRRSGLGSALLRSIEAAGVERGCRFAHLDTFSYQARPFYERHGYTLFGTLDDYPAGHKRYFLRKTLAAPADAR